MVPLPTHTKQYNVLNEPKDFSNLKLSEKAPIPDLGKHDVLVQWKYASLNYRDLIISKVGFPDSVTILSSPLFSLSKKTIVTDIFPLASQQY